MSEDRVRLEDQERLDKPDADALQELVYTYVREAFGGLVGNASGLLSPLAWTEQNNGVDTFQLSLDRLVLCHVENQATRIEDRGPLGGNVNVGAKWGSVVYSFDPTDAGHLNHPIDYTAARGIEAGGPGGTKPYIWARPYGVPSDVDTRRVWNVATGAEVATPVQTRTRQRMEFEISAAAPVQGAGLPWVAIARVWTWGVGPVPSVIYGLSAWDDSDLYTFFNDSGDEEYPDELAGSTSFAHPLERLTHASGLLDGTVNDYPPTERTAGLMYHLHWLRSRLQRHLSGGTTDDAATTIMPWWRVPEISLNGAKVILDDHESRLTLEEATSVSVLQHINTDKWAQVIIAAGTLQFTPDSATPNAARWDWITSYGFLQAVTVVNPQFEITVGVSRQNWGTPIVDDNIYVTGITVTPVPAFAMSGAANWKLPMRLIPGIQNVGSLSYGDVALPAVQQLSDYPAIGNEGYGINFYFQQDNDQNGIYGNVASAVNGLDWAQAQKMAWTITVHGSKFTRGSGAGSF